MIVTIHQPEHLPWAGLFDKISKADKFVILDSVQFRKNYFQNRNKIRIKDGWMWLTIPVSKPLNILICDVKIDNTKNWRRKYLDSIYYSYNKTKYFDKYFPALVDVYKNDWVYLSDLNIELIKYIMKILEIKTDITKASELDIITSKGELILDICKKMNATEYLSGQYGVDYLDESSFVQSGIKLSYHKFTHPIYKQQYEPFIENMSIIDLIFNCGKNYA